MWRSILESLSDSYSLAMSFNLVTWCMIWKAERKRQAFKKWNASHDTEMVKTESRLRELLRSRISDGRFVCARCSHVLDDAPVSASQMQIVIDVPSQYPNPTDLN